MNLVTTLAGLGMLGVLFPLLTEEESDRRIRELRRRGCKVKMVRTRSGTVVMKKCP